MGVQSEISIGITAHCLSSNKTGIGRYAWKILEALHKELPQATFYLYSNRPLDLPRQLNRVVKRESLDTISKKIPVYFWLKFIAPIYIRSDKPDLLWCPATLSPLFYRKTSITTVHDLNHILAKETMPWINALFFKLWFRKDVENALAVVCNSQATADRLTSSHKVKVDAIVRPAVSNCFKPGPKDTNCLVTKNKFMLAVSTIEPRKNLFSLLKAYTELKTARQLDGVDLVLVGRKGWKNSELDSFLEGKQNTGIHFTGFISDDDLINYYRSTSLFVMPSYYEGFGMPVAEALACGAKVLATDIPELKESGQNQCIYTDPTVEGIKQGITLAFSNPETNCNFTPLDWSEEGKKLAAVINRLQNKMYKCNSQL